MYIPKHYRQSLLFEDQLMSAFEKRSAYEEGLTQAMNTKLTDFKKVQSDAFNVGAQAGYKEGKRYGILKGAADFWLEEDASPSKLSMTEAGDIFIWRKYKDELKGNSRLKEEVIRIFPGVDSTSENQISKKFTEHYTDGYPFQTVPKVKEKEKLPEKHLKIFSKGKALTDWKEKDTKRFKEEVLYNNFFLAADKPGINNPYGGFKVSLSKLDKDTYKLPSSNITKVPEFSLPQNKLEWRKSTGTSQKMRRPRAPSDGKGKSKVK